MASSTQGEKNCVEETSQSDGTLLLSDNGEDVEGISRGETPSLMPSNIFNVKYAKI